MTTEYRIKDGTRSFVTESPRVAEYLSKNYGYDVYAKTGDPIDVSNLLTEWSDVSLKTVESIAESQEWDQIVHDMRDEQQRRIE